MGRRSLCHMTQQRTNQILLHHAVMQQAEGQQSKYGKTNHAVKEQLFYIILAPTVSYYVFRMHHLLKMEDWSNTQLQLINLIRNNLFFNCPTIGSSTLNLFYIILS